MRDLKTIHAELQDAMSITDVATMLTLVEELRPIDTPMSKGLIEQSLGFVKRVRGETDVALAHSLRALEMYKQIDYKSGVASVTGNIGSVYFYMGDYAAALDYLSRAFELHTKLGDRQGAARATGSIGIIHYSTSDYPKALEYFSNSLALSEAINDKPNMAVTIGNIGNVYHETGDHEKALFNLLRALALQDELGSKVNIARLLPNIGVVYALREEHAKAFEYFDRALAASEENGDKANTIRIKLYIIQALIEVKQFNEAREKLNAVALADIVEPGVKSFYYTLAAQVSDAANDLDAARTHLLEAIRIALEIGARKEASNAYRELRELALKRNDLPDYVKSNDAYQNIMEEIRGKDTTQKITMMQAEQRIAKERERERAVLYSTLPKHIADRVIRGETVNDHIDNAAVMFIDIVGFTTLSATLSSEHVVKLLHVFFGICDEACAEHGVTRIKTIGDSYMAFSSGTELNGTSSCVNIAHAALQIVARIREVDFKSLLSLQVPSISSISSGPFIVSEFLQVRIGLHCGPVTAGVLGTERLQYDVWGDTVNVASRMESTSEANRIHVSEQFAQSLGDVPGSKSYVPSDAIDMEHGTRNVEHGAWNVELRGLTEIKGKGELTTYWLS